MKIKNIIVAVLALAISAGASAQVNFGVKAGASLNAIPGTYGDMGDDPVANIGFYGGALANISVTDKFFVQAEALYSRKGISTSNPILGKYTRNINYVEIPVMAGLRTNGGLFNVMAGPAFGYCVGDKVKSETYNPASIGNPRDLSVSFVMQTTWFVTDNLGVDLGFDFGITPVFENAHIGDSIDKGRNAGVMVGLSYYFGY